MQIITSQIDSNYLIYAGAIGLFLGLAFLIFFLYLRIRLIVSAFSKKTKTFAQIICKFTQFAFGSRLDISFWHGFIFRFFSALIS